MKEILINKYKKLRLRSFIKERSSFKNEYAFVGAGNHSLSNLYPVLQYLNVPLSTIQTRTKESARAIESIFPGVEVVTSLDQVIANQNIKGVFVSIDPSRQFEVTNELLNSGKYVFVEKPPCESIQELEKLKKFKDHCLVGLQKRYSTINKILTKKLKLVNSYNYQYLTGAYPEGSAIMDLFIHPIDNIIFLFGGYKKVMVERSKGTYLVTVIHDNGVKGLLELSTEYSWNSFTDRLVINGDKNVFEAVYPTSLSHFSKPGKIAGVPLEKLIKSPLSITYDYMNSGRIPVSQFNSLVEQGYLGEVKTFIDLCEGKSNKNLSNPEMLDSTFALIEEIKQAN